MIFNIIYNRPTSCLVLISLLSLFFLASCSDGREHESADTAASAERYPEQVEEAAAAIESRPDLIEEIVVSSGDNSDYAEEAAASVERRPAYADQAAGSGWSYSGSTDQATASVERHPNYSGLSGSSAVMSSGQTQHPAASIGSRPVMSEDTNSIDEYNVVLGVDETIKIPGIPGELRVWIGSSDYRPDFPERMAQDETSIPAVGESATVQPFAPAFKIEPAETQCIRIHPSGSEVRFKLIPEKQGSFEVGANVYLFDSIDCSGSPIPKTAATLQVLVEVDSKEAFLEKVHELWDVLWEKFVEFWAALLVILFGLVLFLIRGKLKRWFGYDDN